MKYTDIRQTKEYAEYLKSTGWDVEYKKDTYYYAKKLPILGSFLKVQRPKEINLDLINHLIKKHKVFRVIIEPSKSQNVNFLQGIGFKKANPYLPSKTLEVNLTKSKRELYESLKKDARLAIKKNNTIKLKKSTTTDFRKYWKASNTKRHIPSDKNLQALQKSFMGNILILLAKDNSTGGLFLKTNNKAYYWHAFTSKTGRKNLTQYKIVWEGILWAKASGCKVVDLEGIYDSRFPDKNWLGFTHFKKSFGGKVIEYPHPLILSPFTKYPKLAPLLTKIMI